MTNVLPPPAQVAGKYAQLFEAFYRQLDPTGKGIITAPDGAKFLKKSGLSDAILSKIWDLSDPNGKGYLDKVGLFVSLKLVSLAQNGREVDIKSVTSETPEPQMGERPSLTAVNQLMDSEWSLTLAEVEKYSALFRSLEVSGKVPGANAKNVMVESKLPLDVLGKVWDLADADKDGALDLTEFVTCMGLLANAIVNSGQIPSTLPKIPTIVSSGVAPSNNVAIPPSTPPLIGVPPPPQPIIHAASILPPKPQPPVLAPAPPVLPPVQPNSQVNEWIVSSEELAKYSLLFTATDKDRDGFVSGLEIRDVFLQSGIPQPSLAHIWNLCDTNQTGKLSLEQFALAMYFINKKLTGFEPPASLLPHMIPPSMRSAMGRGTAVSSQPLMPVETNPEFELISREINELSLEREAIENEIMAKETDKKIKSGEMRSLQTELDTLAATLKQLESQKGVAGAKLGELAAQVNNLRTQAESQEESLNVQEAEVNEKLAEYNGLNQEEVSIETGMKEAQETIEQIVLNLQENQLSIGQAKAKISSLSELHQNMENLTRKFAEVIENGNVYSITEPELMDLAGELSELIGEPEEVITNDVAAVFDSGPDDPFASNDGSQFMSSAAPVAVSFEVEEDPFAALHAPPPLSASSPWSQPDPFAPVHGGSSIKHDFSPGKDPFGHEPFSLHDESPALPPKKTGKAPPPRPAPPKNAPARPPPPKIQSAPLPPLQQPQQTFGDPFGQGDPFGGSEVDHGGFADFANFDQQFNSAISSSSSMGGGSPSPWGPSTASSTSSRTAGKSGVNDYSPLGTTKTLDFTEDPFKNYRYEDPFALADPFQSLAGDPFSQQQQQQQASPLPQLNLQSNSHFGSQLHGTKPIHNNSNNNINNNNSNKNAHHKNGFM